jgi:hypothetical protein
MRVREIHGARGVSRSDARSNTCSRALTRAQAHAYTHAQMRERADGHTHNVRDNNTEPPENCFIQPDNANGSSKREMQRSDR